jgi:hypothetical protein
MKDFEEQSKRLIEEKLVLGKDIEQMKKRLSDAEAVVFSLGTPEAIRQRVPALEQVPRPGIPATPVNDLLGRMSKSKDVPELPMVDLRVSPPEPVSKRPVWGAEPSQSATKSTSILSILRSRQKPSEWWTISEDGASSSADVDMSKGDGVGAAAPTLAPKLISLMAGSRAEDETGKRLRSTGPSPQDQEQPASKKPIAQQDEVPCDALSSSKGRQEREKQVEYEVKRSCSDIAWARTPRLEEVNHWFYDLRDAGTEPPERLIRESRKMVLARKKALGQKYFANDQNAGGWVIRL